MLQRPAIITQYTIYILPKEILIQRTSSSPSEAAATIPDDFYDKMGNILKSAWA